MIATKRIRQIERLRHSLSETDKPNEELSEDEVEAFIQRLYGEDRQAAKAKWLSQLDGNPVDQDTLTLAVSDAKSMLTEVVRLVNRQGESVVLERRDKPVAAIISFADFAEYEVLRLEDRNRRYQKVIDQIQNRWSGDAGAECGLKETRA